MRLVSFDVMAAVPEVVKQEWREKHGWKDGDPPPEVPDPDDEIPTLPLAEASADDDIPFPPVEDAVEATVAPPPLGGRAHARATDPGTSHAAARSVGDLRETQAAVLALFDRLGPMTDEVAAAMYETAAQGGIAEMRDLLPIPRQSPSGLRTRRDELVNLGYLMDTGDRQSLSTGRKGIVWGRTAQALP